MCGVVNIIHVAYAPFLARRDTCSEHSWVAWVG